MSAGCVTPALLGGARVRGIELERPCAGPTNLGRAAARRPGGVKKERVRLKGSANETVTAQPLRFLTKQSRGSVNSFKKKSVHLRRGSCEVVGNPLSMKCLGLRRIILVEKKGQVWGGRVLLTTQGSGTCIA